MPDAENVPGVRLTDDERADLAHALVNIAESPFGMAYDLAPAIEQIVRERMAQAWDERNDARPRLLGPNDGHYEDCMGWEDCYCASYPNPYRVLPPGGGYA